LKVILLGPPGAGKGTQAARIAEKLQVTKAASGDLFRNNINNNTELGQLAKSYMDRGVLVPDDVTIKLIMDWVDGAEQASGFLLDGFPRTLGQAGALDRAMSDKGGLDLVLYINVPNAELIRRLAGRFICRDCQTPYHERFSPPKVAGVCDNCGGDVYQRDDDKAEVVGKRLEVFFAETEPLVEYYRKAGNLKEINGEASIKDVGDAIEAVLS
jgi:adenylate kinase